MITSLSLLKKIQTSQSDAVWNDFHGVYYPLVASWCLRLCRNHDDAMDLVQEVFLAVHQNIQHFHHQGIGSLRIWLKNLLRRNLAKLRQTRFPKLVDFDEMQEILAISRSCAADGQRYESLFQQACAVVAQEFTPNSWQAFVRTHINEEDPVLVGMALNMSRNAVYVARCRITLRLKACLADLLT